MPVVLTDHDRRDQSDKAVVMFSANSSLIECRIATDKRKIR